MGRAVSSFGTFISASVGDEGYIRGVAFMDLGFLIIANSIMRTRLPPKKKKADGSEPTMRTILRDIPFIVYTLGAFFVRATTPFANARINWHHRYSGGSSCLVCRLYCYIVIINSLTQAYLVFYLQLYSSLHGVDAVFTKYSVRTVR